MASYTVKAGDSWAKIASDRYGANGRWLFELAAANGMSVDTMLHPGMVIDLPDFDLSQTPIITNEQWAGVPTGVSGGQTQYGNSSGGPSVPSFQPPAIPSFGGNGTPGKAGGAFPTAQTGAPAATPQTGQRYSPAPTNGVPAAARQSATTPRGPVDQFGIPTAARQQAAPRSGTVPNTSGPKPANPMGGTRFGVPGMSGQYPGAPTGRPTFNVGLPTPGAQRYGVPGNSATAPQKQTNVGDPYSGIPTAARQGGQGNFGQGNGSPPAVNTATPNQPPQTTMSDRAFVAWAARLSGVAINYYGRSGNRNQLPTRMSARVAAQLPYLGAGFGSTEEFMMALGYRMDADGNWTRYDPKVVSSYRPQTSAGYTPSGGGGGGGGGGFSRGPMAQGYDPLGLVNWRIGA